MRLTPLRSPSSARALHSKRSLQSLPSLLSLLIMGCALAACDGGAGSGADGAAAPGATRNADGTITRTLDDGTTEICKAAPAGVNRRGIKAVNTVCPIVDEDGADESVTAEWKRQTIAFCCPTCRAKFNRMNDTEKDAILAKATTYGPAAAK